jgi:transcriptional regulator with XRE-family HTH domain
MEERDTSEIIKRIKERRIMQNLSYQDLADKTGISKSTLQRYETGFIKNLPIDKLEILANALNTTPGYLMGWEQESTDSSLEYSTIKTPEDAMTFILKQPMLMAYGGYDIKKMSSEDLVDFANELLRQLQLISYKFKK